MAFVIEDGFHYLAPPMCPKCLSPNGLVLRDGVFVCRLESVCLARRGYGPTVS